ncbi:hypothetical protein RCL1_005998 [Eukaryota sp. TZLM3-RCL]
MVTTSSSEIDLTTKQLYEPTSSEERSSAEAKLRAFTDNNPVIQLAAVLESTSSNHTRFFVSSALIDIFKRRFDSIPRDQVQELYSRLVTFIVSNVVDLPSFVTEGLARAVSRLIKLAWLDIPEIRSITFDCRELFNKDAPSRYIGMLLLKELVKEVSTSSSDQLSVHRKRCTSFKEQLHDIFALSLDSIYSFASSPATDALSLAILKESLELNTAVLGYDFIGSCSVSESSSDEISTVHVPSSFRPFFEDPRIVTVFFNIIKTVPGGEYAVKSFQSVLRIASVSRSVFGAKENRMKFLDLLLGCTLDLLSAGITPRQFLASSPDILHSLARLFVRIKTNFEFVELYQCSIWSTWVEKVAKFTTDTFECISTGQVTHTIYFLLQFWDKLITSIPYVAPSQTASLADNTPGSGPRSQIEVLAPRVFLSYLQARLELASLPDYDEDEFDASGGHLAHLAVIARCRYMDAAQHVVSAWNQMYSGGKVFSLAWLVRFVGSLLSSRMVMSTKLPNTDSIDIELAALVLRFLVTQSTSQKPSSGLARLDHSLIMFLRQFCRAFLSDKALKAPVFRDMLVSVVNEPLQDNLVGVALSKIISNLHSYPTSLAIIDATLEVFKELITGYATTKMMKESAAIVEILTQHRSSHFTFLSNRDDTDSRFTYYFVLGRVLFDDLHFHRFNEFMKPIDETGQLITTMIASNPQSLLGDSEVRFQAISWLKDLRGLCNAILDKKFYPVFLNWFNKNHRQMVINITKIGAKDADLVIHVLKFVEEIACARSSRCTFKTHSPMGTMLFRDVADILIEFSKGAIGTPVRRDVYDDKLRAVSTACVALSNTLSGNYVNFGVCQLYGDNSLVTTTITLLQTLTEIPVDTVLSYPKAGKNVVVLLDAVCQYYCQLLVPLSKVGEPASLLVYILSFLFSGCKSLDCFVVSNSCASLDALCTFVYSANSGHEPLAQELGQLLALPQCVAIMHALLYFLLKSVLFDDIQNQWSLTRPLLALMLVFPQLFDAVRGELLASLPPQFQARSAELLTQLTDGLKHNLEPNNRDLFSQNLTRVRAQLKNPQ